MARCIEPVPETIGGYPDSYSYNEETRTLRVGLGAFAPVSPEVYGFEVSGLKVVQSWLGYRMKEAAGKKTSPLDRIGPERGTAQFTTELLELLHVLEETVAVQPEQSRLLDGVLAVQCFGAQELLPVPEGMRQDPKPDESHQRALYETNA